MNKTKRMIISILATALLLPTTALAGNLDNSGDPATGSGMPTTIDIYNQLVTGSPIAAPANFFKCPNEGPVAGSGKTLVEIKGVLPLRDSTNAAVANEVRFGKIFWGLGAGSAWGSQTGTVVDGTDVTGANGLRIFTIPNGYYYNSKSATAADTDLTAGNIKTGVSIFGVNGTLIQASGTAVAGDVFAGKTFSNAGATGISGTMPNRSFVSFNPGVAAASVPAGYYGGGQVNGDADLAAGNIKSGVNIFGVSGTAIQSVGTAVAGNVLSGKTFSNSISAGISGTMPNRGVASFTPGAAAVPLPTGYYSGGQVNGDADLVAGNIKHGVIIHGVNGALYGGYTCSGTMDGTRWCDNNNGTIRDMTTGLIWLKNANCNANLNGVNKTGKLTLDNANLWVAGLGAGTCNLSDGSAPGQWWLPSFSALKDLANGTEPVLFSTPRNFGSVQNFVYWTSTPRYYTPDEVMFYYVDMYFGSAASSTNAFNAYVWPVRSGQ